MRERRIGRIRVSVQMVDKEPESVKDIFCRLRFLTLRCECMHWCGAFEYVGECHLFDALSEGEEAPQYRISISTKDGAIESVSAERCT